MRYEFENTRKDKFESIDVFSVEAPSMDHATFAARRLLGRELGTLLIKHSGRFVKPSAARREEHRMHNASVKAQIAGLRA